MEGAQKAKLAQEEEDEETESYGMEEKARAPSKDEEGKIYCTSPDNDGWAQKRKEELEFAILQNAGAYSSQRVNDFEASLSAHEDNSEDDAAKRVRQEPNYGGPLESRSIEDWSD